MELAKRTSLKKIFMTACVRRLLGGPPRPPKNKCIADLHKSHKGPILDQKRQISPKGDEFAPLYIPELQILSFGKTHFFSTHLHMTLQLDRKLKTHLLSAESGMETDN